MNDGQQTPIQEAMSLISIAAILVGIGCYFAALNNVPFLAYVLFGVAAEMYQLLPQLAYLRSPQIPILVASATVGGLVWLLGLPFSGLLAQWFNQSQLSSIERQTERLKKNRAKIQARRRDRDGFDVS